VPKGLARHILPPKAQNPLHRRDDSADYRKASNGDGFDGIADTRKLARMKKCLLTKTGPWPPVWGRSIGRAPNCKPLTGNSLRMELGIDSYSLLTSFASVYSQLAYYISGARRPT